MASVSSTSLAVTLAHAVSHLTRPLLNYYGSDTVSKLQTSLEAHLAAVYVSTWNPSAPLNGSGRRCLTFSPNCLPPRAVYNACLAAEVEWSHWSRALGDIEFDMFIDPGRVSVRVNQSNSGTFSKLVTIWSAELEAQAHMQTIREAQQAPQKKTLAQQLIEEDQAEEDVLFSMLAEELREPAYITPILEQFPAVPVSRSAFGHSRSSSRSSIYSYSSDESLTSCGTFSSNTSLTSSANSSATRSSEGSAKKQSRRERARQARVYVDTTKTEVTPYDGGKTTVLTGGVMLGGAPSNGKKTRRN